MAVRLTIIFLILLFLQAGILLILLPWIGVLNNGDWADNYLLVMAANKTGMPILRQAVASGWVRGAVTALGVLNLIVAFWEIANFSRSVKNLEHNFDNQQRRRQPETELPENKLDESRVR